MNKFRTAFPALVACFVASLAVASVDIQRNSDSTHQALPTNDVLNNLDLDNRQKEKALDVLQQGHEEKRQIMREAVAKIKALQDQQDEKLHEILGDQSLAKLDIFKQERVNNHKRKVAQDK